jgi:hypothetical protein
VTKAIEDAFKKKPADLVKGKDLDAPMAALKDSLIAIKLLPEEHRRPIEDLTNQLRDLEVILKVVAAKNFPGDGSTLRRYRRRSVMLPSAFDLRSSLSTFERQNELEKQRTEAEAKERKEAEAKLDLYKQLETAIRELTELDSSHLETTPQMAHGGFMVPTQFRATELAIQEITRHQQASQVDFVRASIAATNPEAARHDSPELEVASPSVASSLLAAERKFLVGKAAFTPPPPGTSSFRLSASAEHSLSPATLQLLQERAIDVSRQPLDWIVGKLQSEMAALGEELDGLFGRPVHQTFKRVGKVMIKISTPMPTIWNSLVTSNGLSIPWQPFWSQSIPQSHGSVAPAGVADLLVVKQQLVRYEGADVAHIENVLKGEKKEREHTRRRETEELTFRETELTTSEERELESTNRFEMSRETSTVDGVQNLRKYGE